MTRLPVVEKWRIDWSLYRLKREMRSRGSSLIRMAEDEAEHSYNLQRRIDAVFNGETGVVVDATGGYTELEQFKYTSMLLCQLPDDPLDVAEVYITETADRLGAHVEHAGASIALDVGLDELKLGLWSLELDVHAMHSPNFAETQSRTDELRSELERRTQAANEAAESAGEAIGRSRSYIQKRIRIERVLRYLALVCFALVSWGLSEVADQLSLPSLAVALVSFVALERVVGDKLLEPLLIDNRRATLARIVSRTDEMFREVDGNLSLAKRAYQRTVPKEAPEPPSEP